MNLQKLSINAKVLDILYRQVEPERILKTICDCYNYGSGVAIASTYQPFWDYSSFLDYAETKFKGFSENEQRLIFASIDDECGNWKNRNVIVTNDIFIPLFAFTKDILTFYNNEVVCKCDDIMLWRESYLNLGQDIFVCAFLACYDQFRGIERSNLDWPICIRTDNGRLSQLLNQGLAENHNHLKGGTQSFPVTWCRLMNFPQHINRDISDFLRHKSNLLPKMTRGDKYKPLSLVSKIELAALIRSILFRRIESLRLNNNFDSMKNFYKEYIKPVIYSNILYRTIDKLRLMYGAKIWLPDDPSFCLDYALSPLMIKNSADSDIRIVVGERSFLYNCFKACIRKGGFNNFEQQLFYLYLVLKSNFRSEMIQNNGQTGFRNFSNYQDRKDSAWDKNSYFWEAIRIAINDRLKNDSVISLEGRLVPKTLEKANINMVRRYDKAKFFADCHTSKRIIDVSEYDFDTELQLDKFDNLPWFYVFHFTKDYNWSNDISITCRNYEQRVNAEERVCALMQSLTNSQYLRSRIRGIDAASDEFRCRPEVFAKVYRYISKEQTYINSSDDGLFHSKKICINKTYHVGEDFPDLADGLRAIDEAIEFLELEQGNRLGHCLALGVEPEEHYHTKNYEIVTTKQDRLDDLVWVLFRSWELGISIENKLEANLQREAWILLNEIYGNCKIGTDKWHCDMKEYRCSMHLRADDPSCYRNRRFELSWKPERIDNYRLGMSFPELTQYRSDKNISALYYYYHYDSHVRAVGDETYTCKITKNYILLMRQLQEAMMQYVCNHGLIIECNPSSNVLIGTFGSYDKHPIFRFNNRMLNHGKQDCSRQLQVCVNTDDLGVFDTSLEFEYALLYQALKDKKNDNGEPLYGEEDILDYLDDLREMGIRATFHE